MAGNVKVNMGAKFIIPYENNEETVCQHHKINAKIVPNTSEAHYLKYKRKAFIINMTREYSAFLKIDGHPAQKKRPTEPVNTEKDGVESDPTGSDES